MDISTNGGSSFSNVTIASGSRIASLASSPTAGTFFALVGSGSNVTLYRSTNSGSSWASMNKTGNYSVVGVNPSNANYIVIAGSTAAEYSADGGTSWNSMGNPGGAGHVTFSGSKVYVGPSWTSDNGVTWNSLQGAPGTYTSIIKGDAFAIDPANSNNMYIKSGRGVAKSSDGGSTWSDIYSGMNGVTVYGMSQAANKNVVWVAAQGGLARTTNFTAASPSWTFPILPNSSIDFATAVWVNPDDANIVLAGAGGALYRSTDGGSTWADTGAASNGGVNDFARSPDKTTIYAAYGDNSSGGVLKSTNNGATWINTGLSVVSVNAVDVSSNGTVYAGVGTENNTAAGGIYKYSGSSWSKLSGASGYLVNDVLVVGSTVYAAAGATSAGGVFKSTNAGASWRKLTRGLPSDGWFKSLAYQSGTGGGNIYVSTARPSGTGYIYKSVNKGTSWGLYYTGLVDEAFNGLLFDGLVSGTDTGLYSYKTKASVGIRAYRKIIVRRRRRRRARYRRFRTVKKGALVYIKVTLKDAATKTKLKRKLVRLYRRVGRRWRYFKKARTNRRGYLFFRVRIRRSTVFLARWRPRRRRDRIEYAGSRSRSYRVRTPRKPRPLSLNVSRRTINKRRKVKFFGRIRPRRRSVRIYLYRRRLGSKRWRRISSARTNSRGIYKIYRRPIRSSFYRTVRRIGRRRIRSNLRRVTVRT